MQVGDETLEVTAGDIVLIKDGLFHKVWNTGDSDLIFNCVFEGKRNH
jgi:oxalate decarboxylase/phosphoglucose isomerase-like protein (cupin superfamily)